MIVSAAEIPDGVASTSGTMLSKSSSSTLEEKHAERHTTPACKAAHASLSKAAQARIAGPVGQVDPR
jgi:hypothetical protein